jgi:hypothetical protein
MSGATPTLELTTGVAMDDIAYEINAKFKLDYSAIGVTSWEKVDKTFGVVFYPFA